MSIKINLLAVSQTFLALAALATANAPIVDLGYAQYQGSVDTTTNTTSFLGIRYAAPPLDNLRWAAPQPPPTVSGVQQATTQPNQCYQGPLGNASTNPFENISLSKRDVSQSEDCLFLSVYTPGSTIATTPSGRLPVVVFIHGGGYVLGAESLYDGAELITESDYGVISVIIQYRLGLFGFLSGEAVKEGGALNAGLLDQNYALQWVQAYISQFGGDPTKVTIWGQSAGAGSVIQHIVAHGGNTHPPLFRAAMTSSTFLPSQYNYNDPIPEILYSMVVNGTNCGSSSDTLSCLRAVDVNTLQTLNTDINLDGFYGMIAFIPVVDGTFIVERPTLTLSKGRLNGNHLLSVTNTHEGNVLVDQSMTMDIADFIGTIYPDFGPAQIAGAASLYQNMGSNVNQANLAIGESMFLCPTYYMLEAFRGRAWKGEFAIPPGLHGDDIGEYFTSYTSGPQFIDGPLYNNSQFITSFSNSFMAMVMFETPDHRYTPGDITPPWNIWQRGLTEMIFNETSAGLPHVYTSTTGLALLERCAYWRSVSAYIPQ